MSALSHQKKVFISHAGINKDRAFALAESLARIDITSWVAEVDLAQHLSMSIALAIKNCSILVCLMSPEFDTCWWCSKEFTFAMSLKKEIFAMKLQEYEANFVSGLHLTDYFHYYKKTKVRFCCDSRRLIVDIEDKLKEMGKLSSTRTGSASDDDDSDGDDDVPGKDSDRKEPSSVEQQDGSVAGAFKRSPPPTNEPDKAKKARPSDNQNTTSDDCLKCNMSFDLASELVSIKRELERQKELVSSQEMKAKWHQNKLKAELESHRKDTKIKFDEVQLKLKESKEECDKIRLESQSFIKTYQMSQVMDTITKELQLKETEELLNRRMEQTEQQEVLQLMKQELDSLKVNEKELVEELNTYKDKVTCLEAERILQEDTRRFKDTLQSEKKVNREMAEQIAELETLQPETNELRQKLAEAQKEVEELKQAYKDLTSDMDSYVNQESEHLNFSQKLSDETVRLQSDNLSLGDEVASLTNERESLKASMFCLSSKCQALEVELEKLVQMRQQQSEELEKQLKEKTLLAEQLAKQLEDREDELKTLQRHHISSSKSSIHKVGMMMECQSTDSGGSDNVSESLSNECLNQDSVDNSAMTSRWQQSCLELPVPAVLPCCQTEQSTSVTGFQLDPQSVTEAQLIVSFSDSKQDTPELSADANQELQHKIVQFNEQSQLLASASLLVSTSAILERSADKVDEKLQKSSHRSHPCENLLINNSLSVSSHNNGGESNNTQPGVTRKPSGEIHCETSNLLCRNSQEKCSSNEFEEDGDDCRAEPSNELRVHSHQQNADDDGVDQLLEKIESFERPPELSSSERSLIDHPSDDRCSSREQEECDQLAESCNSDKSSSHQDNQNSDSQPLGGSSSESQLSEGGISEERDISRESTVNEGVAIATADQIMPDQLPAAYNVLVHRYLLLRQHRSEQLAIQRQMEEDQRAISARLASVTVDRDSYMRKLDEYKDFGILKGEKAEVPMPCAELPRRKKTIEPPSKTMHSILDLTKSLELKKLELVDATGELIGADVAAGFDNSSDENNQDEVADQLEDGEIVDPEDAAAAWKLQYIYEPGQWTPLNPDGRKVFGRNFLLQLQFIPESMEAPPGLPDLPEIVREMVCLKTEKPWRHWLAAAGDHLEGDASKNTTEYAGRTHARPSDPKQRPLGVVA